MEHRGQPFRLWRKRGVWQEAVPVLGTRGRVHGGKKIRGRSRHVAIDRQGTLLAGHVSAANKADSAEAGAVMVQAVERHPTLESFTADQSHPRQAAAAARALPGRDLQVTAPPKATARKKVLRPSPSAGASSGRFPGLARAACSPRSTKRPSLPPKRGSGAR